MGVVVTDKGNGLSSFTYVDDEPPRKPEEEPGVLKRIWNWFTGDAEVRPYVKYRDVSDPFDKRKNDPSDDLGGGKKGVEVGIRIKF